MSLMQSIDARTTLVGTNHLEVLLFSLGRDRLSGREELYGINVFKVREVLNKPQITTVPEMHESVEGITSIRGELIPVINLQKMCGIKSDDAPKILIVTEYNEHVQGFLVPRVDTIKHLRWSDVKPAPALLSNKNTVKVTSVAKTDDNKLIMILDVEQVLADVGGFYSDELFDEIEQENSLTPDDFILFYADDSSVARNQIKRTAKALGVTCFGENNGMDAWGALQKIAAECEMEGVPVISKLSLILTDVEMPEMDGYVLTRKIKADPRFKEVPVYMHSSLSASENQRLGLASGADKYLPKFNPKNLAEAIIEAS